jgi:hypothetical protein
VNSPLSVDKETVTKHKIPKEVELLPRQKLAFLEEQLHQLKAMHWRARVDMLHAKRLQESDNPTLAEKGLSNMATHRNEVEQTIGAIQMVNTLVNELRAEHPDLGEVAPQDHPDA